MFEIIFQCLNCYRRFQRWERGKNGCEKASNCLCDQNIPKANQVYKERNLYEKEKKGKEIKEKYRSHFFRFRTIFLYSIVLQATDDDLISRGTEISKKSRHFGRRLLDNRLKYARARIPPKRSEIRLCFVKNLCISLSGSVSTVVTTKIDK